MYLILKVNYKFFVVSVIWLPQGQLLATGKETALIIFAHYLSILILWSREPCNKIESQNLTKGIKGISRIQTENHSIQNWHTITPCHYPQKTAI